MIVNRVMFSFFQIANREELGISRQSSVLTIYFALWGLQVTFDVLTSQQGGSKAIGNMKKTPGCVIGSVVWLSLRKNAWAL